MRQRARPSPRTLAAVLGLLGVLLVLPLALAARADAEPEVGTAIGRANLDGTGVDHVFIDGGLGYEGDVALDAEHVYWTRSENVEGTAFVSAIGRAGLDGSSPQQNFVGGLPYFLTGLAVDAKHVYWTHERGIGRANLDGSGVDQSFIGLEASNSAISGIAVDASHIYWAHESGIGRANLDGSGVDQSFIGEVRPTGGLAIDAQYLYWLASYCVAPGQCGDALGRANLGGSDVQESFIAGPPTYVIHGNVWTDVAVDGAHIYATKYDYGGNGSIDRANPDGTGQNFGFLSGVGLLPGGVAVDAGHIYWTHRTVDNEAAGSATASRTQKQTGSRIIVRVKVKADEQLTAEASGKIKVNPTYKLKPQKVQVAAGKTKTLKLKPKKKAARKIAKALNRGENATAKLKAKLTDLARNSETEKLRVRLK